MDRLTERTGEGQAIPWMDLRNNGHQKCMERLAEYEDTGLTPEEIMDGKLLTGWIPVGERLPDEPEYFDLDEMELYIVMVEGAEKPAALYYAGEGDWMDENKEFYSVLAWMPLPEPYKLEEEICGK